MSNIKINDVFQRIQYAATNGQTEFTIPFPFFENDYVYVWQNGVQLFEGGAPGQYDISGAGSPSGGLITLVTPAVLNDIITIEGIMPIDRTSIYSPTISNLTGSDLNGDFNREVVMMKQIQTTQALLQLQYAPWTEISQDPDVTKDRYIPLLGPGEVWRMNDDATAIEPFEITGSSPSSNDTYWVSTETLELPNSINLGALTSGLLMHTVVDGFSTPETAVNGVNYWAPGDELTRAQAPVVGNDVCNKTYVDAIAGGFTFLQPVNAASTGALTVTYDNGTSGIGATLTNAGAQAAFSLDGETGILNYRYLIKDQASALQNGIYILTTVGDGSTDWVLTRATDFDEPSEISPGDLVLVLAGSANSDTLWLQTATVNTIGTDPIDFSQFGAALSDVMRLSTVQTVTGQKTFNVNTFRLAGSTSGNATLNAPAIAGSNVYTLPATGGTLALEGSGGGIGSIKVTTITASGNFTPDADVVFSDIYVTGSGASGGSGQGAGSPLVGPGGGGGSGGTSIAFGVPAATIGAGPIACTVGLGGAAPAAGNNPGNNGNVSSFPGASLTITANGGFGGSAGTASGAVALTRPGGNGATAGSGGDINMPGIAGGRSIGNGASGLLSAGQGAPSPLYGGGANSSNSGNLAGSAGTAPGSGGSGGASTTANTQGGAGARGEIVVVEYLAA